MTETEVKTLEAQLRQDNPRFAVVLSARAALRAVPALSFLLSRQGHFRSSNSTQLILAVFRALQASWHASVFPNAIDPTWVHDAADAVDAAARPIGSEGRNAIFVPAYAAYAAAGNNAPYTGAIAIDGAPSANHFAALQSAFPAGRRQTANRVELRTREAGNLDYVALREGLEPRQLACQPLWYAHRKELAWMRNAWGWLKGALHATDEDWEVWTGWYDARLEGRRANEPLEFARAAIPSDDWLQGPKVVNAQIKGLIVESPSQVDLYGHGIASDAAKAFRKRGRHDEALFAYESAIERFPADPVAYNGRAEVLREMGRHDEALRAYESAIEHFPADLVGYNGRAEVLRELGRHDEALRAYESSIEHFSADLVAFNGRAEVLREMGRHDEALRAYEKAIELFPANGPLAYSGRAEVLREMGRREEALRAYESVIEQFPADVYAYNRRAEVLREMGNLDEALQAYDRAIEQFPGDVVAHNGRAEVLREMGRIEAAPQPSENAVPPPADAIPAPERRALQFMSAADGPIDLAALSQPGEHLVGGPSQQEDYGELRVKAIEIGVLGSNRLGRLYGPINRFLGLSENVDQVRAKLFWSRINTLRLILLSHEQTTEVQNGEPDERRLEPTAASLLKDLVETINVFVVGDPGLMELDAVRPGPKETEIAKEETRLLAPMIDDLANNPDVATEPARENLSEQAENLETADSSLPGRQSAEFGRRSIQNFVGELLRRAYAPVRELPRRAASEVGVAWKGVREGAYRAVGAGLITGAVTDLIGATNFSGAIIRFVVRHAEALVMYVTKSFQNPTLVEIINWIVRLGS